MKLQASLMKGGVMALVAAALCLSLTATSRAQCGVRQFFASNGMPNELTNYGDAIAVDGTHLVVGASTANNAFGNAYVYDLATGTELLNLPGSTILRFGASVGLSGNTAAIGAPLYRDAMFNQTGAVFLYDIGTGAQSGLLTPADNGSAGDSMDIEGNLLLTGSTISSAGATFQAGAAYLFDLTTGAEIFKLTASDATTGAGFGRSVALAGNRAIVGAWAAPGPSGESRAGAVYVFDTVTGNELYKITAPSPVADGLLGWNVSADGNLAILSEIGTGNVHVLDIATGVLTDVLQSTDPSLLQDEIFGRAAALVGTTAAIAAGLDNETAISAGALYLYDLTGVAPPRKLTVARSNRLGADAIAFDGTRIYANEGLWFSGFQESVMEVDTSTAISAFPGTNEDLSMITTVNFIGLRECAVKTANVGDFFEVGFLSRGGLFALSVPLLAVQPFVAANPPSPVFPGIALDPFINPLPSILLDGNAPGPIGQQVLPFDGIFLNGVVFPAMSGFEFLFQAYVFSAAAANGNFASTDGLVLSVN